ncbi:hypothetical protein CRG98_015969 [Punica granatum]|uniref:Uncharacterized protein n=1 Tax=Punica granatum TaxID=22663 RepID=A0A2I0K526_PUNGR|nr:hypothetical protein CRG98_015969 [Punica granatum]
MHRLHLPDLPLLKAIPEAHQNQEAEHCVLEVVHGPHRRLGAGSPEPVQQDVQDPPACSGIGPDAGRVQDLRGQVAAEDPPRGAVEGGADVVLVAAQDLDDGQGGGAGKGEGARGKLGAGGGGGGEEAEEGLDEAGEAEGHDDDEPELHGRLRQRVE